MMVPCEVAIRLVIPTVRALLAKELHQTYKFRQRDIATLLGVTQSAISHYLKNKRGHAILVAHSPILEPLINDLANGLVTRTLTQRQIMQKYCGACYTIRAQKWLCDLHKTLDPTVNNDACEVCLSITCF